MKSNFWKYAVMLATCVAAVASCKKPEPEKVEPVFPTDVITKTVAAGESVQIPFEPNMAWTVSVSGDGSGNYFWIDDDGMKATSVSGKTAGPAVITVEFSEDEEFDKNRVCDVTLKMGDQSKKIATLTRPSLGRTFEIYAGVAGEYEFTEDFGQETFTEASLVTFAGIADYTLPVRVVTNYPWDIVLPSWLKALNAEGDETVSGEIGTTDLLLVAVPTDEVIEGAEAAVKFLDRNNSSASNEVKIILPDFSSRMEYDINSLDFNAAGQVRMPNGSYEDGSAIAYVLAAKGMTVKALEWTGDYHDTKYAEWDDIAVGEYDESAGVLQNVAVTLSVTENTGQKRYADIFIFPVSMGDVKAEDICDFNDPSCGFYPEYEQYYIGRLTQAGEPVPYVTPLSSEEARAEVGTFFNNLDPTGDDNIMQYDFPNAGSYQKITYTGEWSYEEASFECSEPYAYVKLFEDTDYPVGVFTKEIAEDDECWISFVGFGDENTQGRFYMNHVPSSATHTAAIFYDSSDNILGAVLVVFDPQFTGGGDESAYKISAGRGEIAPMDKNSELYMAISGSYNVTEAYEIVTNDKMLFVEGETEFYGAFAVDPATFADYAGKISVEGSSPDFYVYTSACKGRDEMIVVLQTLGPDGESMVNFVAFHIIFDPDADIDVEAPFSFVYPDYVGGMATLEKHTGEYADMIIADWGASQAPKDIYLLTYYDPSASSVAVLNVPAGPWGGASYNNYDPATGGTYADYWLTHEMDGNQMYVFMSEAGKVDYFIFTDSMGLPSCALVCTMALSE
jgi:hypothetical protein